MHRPYRVIRRADLFQFVGLKKTQIDELVKRREFPAPISLSDNGRAKAWLESEILEWQQNRLAKRKSV